MSPIAAAARSLLRRPGYSIPAVVTLGIGIAAVALTYAIAHAVMLRPVPGVTNPHRLVTAQLESMEDRVTVLPVSHPDLVELRRRVPTAGTIAAYTPQEIHLAAGAGAAPERVHGEIVTANYFSTLQVALTAGAGFAADRAACWPPSSVADCG